MCCDVLKFRVAESGDIEERFIACGNLQQEDKLSLGLVAMDEGRSCSVAFTNFISSTSVCLHCIRHENKTFNCENSFASV